MIARTLVDPFEQRMPVHLVNLDDRPIKLRRNYLLGELHPIDYVTEVTSTEEHREKQRYSSSGEIDQCKIHRVGTSECPEFQASPDGIRIPDSWLQGPEIRMIKYAKEGKQTNKADIEKLPDFLQDLHDRSSKNLTSEELKQKLKEFLNTNKDVFASSKSDLGSSSVVNHRIDTAGTAPIRQALRRTPLGFEQEEEKYLREMINTGGIKPSSSASASNLVLVRKHDQTVRWCWIIDLWMI